MKFFISILIVGVILVAVFQCDSTSEQEADITVAQRDLENEKAFIIQELNELNRAIGEQQAHIKMLARTSNSRVNENIKDVVERLLNQKEVIGISLNQVMNSSESKWDDVRYGVRRNVTGVKIEFSRVREKIRNEIDTNNLIK